MKKIILILLLVVLTGCNQTLENDECFVLEEHETFQKDKLPLELEKYKNFDWTSWNGTYIEDSDVGVYIMAYCESSFNDNNIEVQITGSLKDFCVSNNDDIDVSKYRFKVMDNRTAKLCW